MRFSAKTIRRLRRFLIALACLVTLLAVIWQIENFRGERARKAAFKTYSDRGDPLDMLPAPRTISPDKNFWQTPLLARLALARHDSQALKEFKAANPLHDLYLSAPETWSNGQPLNLDSLAQQVVQHRQKRNLPAFSPELSSAAILLAQFPITDPVFAELREAALTRPESGLVRNEVPPLGQLFDMAIPSFPIHRYLSRSLSIQACAALSTGDAETAFPATLAGLQFANGLGHQPYTIVEAMMAVVFQNIAIQPVWEGIQHRVWTDEQLAHFSHILSRSDLFAGLAQSLRNERNNLMQIQLSSLKEKQFQLYRFMPEGWWRQNQVTYADMHQPILLAIDLHSTPAFLDRLHGSKLTPQSIVSPYQFVAWTFLPAYEKVTANTARSTNAVRLALTACALERHYLSHGAYPESLDKLVPAFLSAVPLDVIDGSPLRYRLTPDATFTLYSIALDGDDDNGRRVADPTSLDADGDWAW